MESGAYKLKNLVRLDQSRPRHRDEDDEQSQTIHSVFHLSFRLATFPSSLSLFISLSLCYTKVMSRETLLIGNLKTFLMSCFDT